jgi:hypothetical protein
MQKQIKDERIIVFSECKAEIDLCKLPDNFISFEQKKMIYASGDGYGGYKKPKYNNINKKTNIECFSQSPNNFNVFCCLEMETNNIEYLIANPKLNIVLCILTGDKNIDENTLNYLFNNSLSVISTDDKRLYPSAKLSFSMLKVEGICENLRYDKLIGSFNHDTLKIDEKDYDKYWGEPNFTRDDHNLEIFKKTSDKFIEDTNVDIYEQMYISNLVEELNKSTELLKSENNKLKSQQITDRISRLNKEINARNERIAKLLKNKWNNENQIKNKSWKNWHVNPKSLYKSGGRILNKKKLYKSKTKLITKSKLKSKTKKNNA